jgi:hypothetical protein
VGPENGVHANLAGASTLDYPASRHCELVLAGMRQESTAIVKCSKLALMHRPVPMERTSNGWKSDARAKALVDLCYLLTRTRARKLVSDEPPERCEIAVKLFPPEPVMQDYEPSPGLYSRGSHGSHTSSR